MDFNRVELEQDDAAHMDRIGPGVRELFNTYKFYYIKKYPLNKLLDITSADLDGLKTKEIATKFYNINYRMLEHWDDTEWIDWFTRAFYYLVTSFDAEGIKVPVNLYESTYYHPGGKRVCIGSYLGMDTVPALLQTKTILKEDVYDLKICKPKELSNIYPNNNFTAFIQTICPAMYKPLEVYYFESLIRTDENIDGWMERGQDTLRKFNTIAPPCYLLKHGLNVVNPDLPEHTRIEKGKNGYLYKTVFSKKPKADYYIKLNDTSLNEQNFWKLAYHFDPRYRIKYTKKKEIEIRNTHSFATEEMRSAYMLKTLCQEKHQFSVTPKLGSNIV